MKSLSDGVANTTGEAAAKHFCCHGDDHSEAQTKVAAAGRKAEKKYFCPMCEGVESDAYGTGQFESS